jgi:uncharacterized protein YbjT (DUF2867 family)
MTSDTVAITGAFSYTGKYITRLLLAEGRQVITLTGHPERQAGEFDGQVRAFPFDFERPEHMVESLRGVTTLYNTYWVRFDHGEVGFDRAVVNTLKLFEAAQAAAVQRLVHVSITNPSPGSPLPYFRGKALIEQVIPSLGLSYAILRPTVIFGLEDILINNIAYLLRTFPLFVIPGNGKYRLQPVYVEDMAQLAVKAGASRENLTQDVVGPQIYTFNELVVLIARALRRKPLIFHLPPAIPLWLSRLIGLWVRDVVLTNDEYLGLSSNLLVSAQPPTGWTRLEDWLAANADRVGRRYASELQRHYRQDAT